MNHQDKEQTNVNKTSVKITLFLGFMPLIITALVCISLTLCIQISRYYSYCRLKNQLPIVRYSEQCLIVSNPSIDNTDHQEISEVV